MRSEFINTAIKFSGSFNVTQYLEMSFQLNNWCTNILQTNSREWPPNGSLTKQRIIKLAQALVHFIFHLVSWLFDRMGATLSRLALQRHTDSTLMDSGIHQCCIMLDCPLAHLLKHCYYMCERTKIKGAWKVIPVNNLELCVNSLKLCHQGPSCFVVSCTFLNGCQTFKALLTCVNKGINL